MGKRGQQRHRMLLSVADGSRKTRRQHLAYFVVAVFEFLLLKKMQEVQAAYTNLCPSVNGHERVESWVGQGKLRCGSDKVKIGATWTTEQKIFTHRDSQKEERRKVKRSMTERIGGHKKRFGVFFLSSKVGNYAV